MQTATMTALLAAIIGALGVTLAGLQLRQNRRSEPFAGEPDEPAPARRVEYEPTWPGPPAAPFPAPPQAKTTSSAARRPGCVGFAAGAVLALIVLSGAVVMVLSSGSGNNGSPPGPGTTQSVESPTVSSPTSTTAPSPSSTSDPVPTVTVTVTALPTIGPLSGGQGGGPDGTALLAAIGAVIAGLGTAASGAASVISMRRKEPGRRRDTRTRYRGRL
ncbi:hypothetical protein GCM10023196_068010 [Actinoallomurus vinaceus]|uniref:Uncharacterized protein n=1 Tax=Actinoallomurus vinaceus TaxID=1080074 RepID=A0ABP8UJ29_9ACTN